MVRAGSSESHAELSASVAERRDAVLRLYESHFERVVRYIRLKIGDPQEAEDLGVEVFVRAIRSADSYRETGAPMEAWLFRIARNLAADYFRARQRRPAPLPLESVFGLSGGNDPAKLAEESEERQALQSALDQLTDAQRQVLALRFGAELPSQQVAEIMGTRDGAVREMQRRAVLKLREVMSGRASGEAL